MGLGAGVVLGVGHVCLGRGIVDGWVGGCVVILTTLFWGSGVLFLGYTFFGKGDVGV